MSETPGRRLVGLPVRAGARRLAREGLITPNARSVAVLTGHLLKDLEIVSHYHRDREPPPAHANRLIEINARLDEVERVMKA